MQGTHFNNDHDYTAFLEDNDSHTYPTDKSTGVLNSKLGDFPIEIMTEIFALACHDNSPFDKYSKGRQTAIMTTPFIIGHVCFNWRYVVWSSSYIWSHIFLRLSLLKFDKQCLCFKEWKNRSGNHPLTLHITFEDEEEWSRRVPMEFIDILCSTSPRWKEVYFSLPEAWFQYLDILNVKHRLPILEKVVIMPLGIDLRASLGSRKRVDLFRHAPVLWEADVNHYSLEEVIIPWIQLRHLTLKRIYLDECFYALCRTPGLVQCTIGWIYHLQYAFSHIILDQDHCSPVRLSSLKNLTIHDASRSDIYTLLSNLHIPRLQTLAVLSGFGRDLFKNLPYYLSKAGCQGLTTLKLAGLRQAEGEKYEYNIITCIRHIPTLVEIDIEVPYTCDPLSDIFSGLFLDRKIETMPNTDTQDSGFYLPALERSSISGPVTLTPKLEQDISNILRQRGSGVGIHQRTALLSSFKLITQSVPLDGAMFGSTLLKVIHAHRKSGVHVELIVCGEHLI